MRTIRSLDIISHLDIIHIKKEKFKVFCKLSIKPGRR
jgi:hypothetical protein